VTLIALTILLLLFRDPATAALNQWTGAHSWSAAGRAAAIRTLTLLVLVALIFALDAEVRALLVVVDALGIDIFLMLLFFQGRELLHWLTMATCIPAVRFLETRSWYPLPIPNRALFKHHPFWSFYAAAQPLAIALMISAPVIAVMQSLKNALI
jgi:hypothetical protein